MTKLILYKFYLLDKLSACVLKSRWISQYLLTFFLIFFISSISYSQWYEYSSGTNITLKSIFFPVKEIGYTVGAEGTIIKSTNGGLTWHNLSSNTTYSLNRCYFINVDTGFVVGGYLNQWGEHHSIILKTTNGGLNWINQTTGQFPLSDIKFFNHNTGICVGQVGTIFKTTNMGIDWLFTSISGVNSFEAISGISDSIVYIAGNNAKIYKSINYGSNWIQVAMPYNYGINCVYFYNEQTGYVSGSSARLVKTTNSGINWFIQSNGVGLWIYSTFFLDLYKIYTVGDSGKIVHTTNGGIDWTYQYFNPDITLHSVYFINDTIGFACGSQGKILKTTNGGFPIGIKPGFSQIPVEFNLIQNYPNPFNPITKISYDIPQNSIVKLTIYDILGREVMKLVNNEFKQPGRYMVEFNGTNLASGVYFYTIEAHQGGSSTGDFIDSKKMVLIK